MNAGMSQSDYAYYLELNRKYEEMRLQVLQDMENFAWQPSEHAEDVEEEAKPTVMSGPSILEDENGHKEDISEDLREKYYKLFVQNKEKTVLMRSPREERKRAKKKRRRSKPKKEQSLSGKAQKKKREVLSPKKIKEELSKRLTGIKDRLSAIQNKAHDELLYAEDEYSIKNMELLEKLFPTFLEMIAVRWEEVADLLVDDLLYDTVRELNVIDSLKQEQWVPKEVPPEEDKENRVKNVDVVDILNDYLECEQSLNSKYANKQTQIQLCLFEYIQRYYNLNGIRNKLFSYQRFAEHSEGSKAECCTRSLRRFHQKLPKGFQRNFVAHSHDS
eukprot:TRINITY_DN671_c0_g1_i2.p2 TRINITY_DN671_c0_g1~~TRINITY_DN671_c0_g1_i2.p2  ORF type:complete len:366 (-),score=37.58 TRINITY_DN671_c0_g1_i2:1861-2853(-)